MAISLIQFKQFNGAAGAVSITLNSPVSAGSLVVVAPYWDSGAGGGTATAVAVTNDKSDPVTNSALGYYLDATGVGTSVEAFLAPTAGAQTFTVTPNNTSNFAGLGVWEFSGLTSPVFDKAVKATTTGSPTTPSSGSTGTLSAANEVAIGYGQPANTFTAAGSGWTSDLVDSAVSGNLYEHQIVSATTALAATGTCIGASAVVWCVTFMAGGAGPAPAGPGNTPPLIFRPRQGPSRGLTTPRSTFIPPSTVIPGGPAIIPPQIFRPGQGPTRGLRTGRSTFIPATTGPISGVASSAGVGTARGIAFTPGVAIDAFSSGATNGGWRPGSLGRAADLDGFGSPTNDSPVTVNQGFGFITIGSSATALLFGVSMASQGHGANNPGTLTVTLNPSGSNQVMTQLGTLVDHGGTQGGPTYLFGLVSPASGTGNIQIAWTNFTNIQEFYVYAISFTGTATSSVSAAFYGYNTANDGGTVSTTNQVSTSVPVASGDMAFALHINPNNGFHQPADNATGTEMDDDQAVTNNSYGQYFTGAGSVITARADNTSPFGTTDFWSASVVAIGTAPSGGSVAASTGTGAANGVGAALFSGVGASSGVGSATGAGTGLDAATAASAGASTVQAVGAAIASSVASSAGVGDAEGVGSSITGAQGVGSSAGVATVTGAGASLSAAVGASSGVGTATAFTGSLDAGTGASAGAGAATGIGASLAASVGAAAGTGTALGVGDSQQAGQSVGAATGLGTATGVGASLFAAIGNAAGTAIVVGVSPVTELPAGGAGHVTVGHRFTRKRWKELLELIAAEEAAAAKAQKVGSPARREALAEASGKAADAISALEGVEGREAYEPDMGRLQAHLQAATAAKKVADSVREARAAAALAAELQAEADEENEINMLLDDPQDVVATRNRFSADLERIAAMIAAMTKKS